MIKLSVRQPLVLSLTIFLLAAAFGCSAADENQRTKQIYDEVHQMLANSIDAGESLEAREPKLAELTERLSKVAMHQVRIEAISDKCPVYKLQSRMKSLEQLVSVMIEAGRGEEQVVIEAVDSEMQRTIEFIEDCQSQGAWQS